MSDILERLRSKDILTVPEYWRLQDQAADEIERLKSNYKELAAHHNQHCICREIY
jgi:hypothetical protein